jgi:indole-3-glycerol phosphate synthase
MSADILKKICDDKLLHVASQKQKFSEQQLQTHAKESPAPRGFYQSLKTKADKKEVALIAEVKKASPSKGLIRKDFDPVAIAKSYEAAGASCISVLTDIPYFQGSDAYLQAVTAAVSLPTLRKDFMLDPYQVLEARALGASCILLIMAALSDEQAKELEAASSELGMDVLVEVHDKAEMERALLLRSQLIGVNNRNLKTLEISLSTTEILASMVPSDRLLVCESGIYSHEDIQRMQQVGAYTFLVGESLMRQPDIEVATKTLLLG